MLIGANYSGALWNILLGLYVILHSISQLAGILWLIDLILLVLGIISWLGGFAVILGGLLLTTQRVGTGKFIIGIAAGFGLIGFILALIQVVLVGGLAGLLIAAIFIMNSMIALGLVLTIIARTIADDPPKKK